jgi:hypothetical protein
VGASTIDLEGMVQACAHGAGALLMLLLVPSVVDMALPSASILAVHTVPHSPA